MSRKSLQEVKDILASHGFNPALSTKGPLAMTLEDRTMHENLISELVLAINVCHNNYKLLDWLMGCQVTLELTAPRKAYRFVYRVSPPRHLAGDLALARELQGALASIDHNEEDVKFEGSVLVFDHTYSPLSRWPERDGAEIARLCYDGMVSSLGGILREMVKQLL